MVYRPRIEASNLSTGLGGEIFGVVQSILLRVAPSEASIKRESRVMEETCSTAPPEYRESIGRGLELAPPVEVENF
jgi:hypothetical protein